MLKFFIYLVIIPQITLAESYDRGGKDNYSDERRDGQIAQDKCFRNEERRECGPACPQSCKFYNKPCTFPLGKCKPGCYCRDGYVRIESDCLPAKDVCCPDENCLDACKIYLHTCERGCYCFQNPENLIFTCTNITYVPVRCPKANQVFNLCPQTCTKTCTDPTGSRCEPTLCNPKCVCKDGYVRDRSKNCISQSCCPKIYGSQEIQCGDNEVFKRCGQDNICNTTPVELPYRIAVTCKLGCFCITGYSRNSDHVCVPDSDCNG